jgi:hypothetical protein
MRSFARLGDQCSFKVWSLPQHGGTEGLKGSQESVLSHRKLVNDVSLDEKICRQLRRLQHLWGALTPSSARFRMGLHSGACIRTLIEDWILRSSRLKREMKSTRSASNLIFWTLN